RFLSDAFLGCGSRPPDIISGMIAAYLDAAAIPDGVIEIAAVIRRAASGCVFLQGWGSPSPEECEILVVGEAGVGLHSARTASFSRPDTNAPATGQVLLLPPAAVERYSGGITASYLLAGNTLSGRKHLSALAIKSEEEGLGHIQQMLPRLCCSAATRDALSEALRPRFDGRDTLNSSGQPIRAAIDFVAADRNSGLYLTGWIYDPAEVASLVRVRNGAGYEYRLDA